MQKTQSLLTAALVVYMAFYVFEGAIRYAFHLLGQDELIFSRDIIIGGAVLLLFVAQLLKGKIHPAFWIFFFIITLHGFVILFNMHSFIAIVYSAKMFMTVLVGALASRTLLHPSRTMLAVMLFFWLASWGGILADKYYVEFPWIGLKTSFEDVTVDVSRDWQITGEDKRAGGFTRSSINAATLMPLLAIVLMFNMQSLLMRVAVTALTVPALVWTTQKGSIIAYLLLLALMAILPRRPMPVLRLGALLMMILMVGLPVILPGYHMQHAKGVFSLSSFNQRVEQMWPDAWTWIHRYEIFPFGVGLGGISGAQRLYAPYELNAADNLFILMYAFFGVVSFIYLGWILYLVARTKNNAPTVTVEAMAMLVFLLGYGCVISILEDQMGSLFFGAAVAWLAQEIRQNKQVPAT